MRQFIPFIVMVMAVFFLAACSPQYVCPHGGGTAKSLQECPGYGTYVEDYALTLADLPADYVIDDGETGIQLGSEITENDLQRGWKEGYFCGFVALDEEEQLVREGVYCFVSRYDAASLQGVFEGNDQANESENITRFSAPTIGDAGVAYWHYDAEIDVTFYTIEFVKRDIYAGVTMERVGKADLSADVIRYAQLIASKIPS